MENEGHPMLSTPKPATPAQPQGPVPSLSPHSATHQLSQSPVSSPSVSTRSSIRHRNNVNGFQPVPKDENHEHETSTENKGRRLYNAVEATWIAEVIGYLIAVLALLAIVILLKVYEGKPLPQWPSLISVNSLISIFTSILKAAMLLPVAEGISELKWVWYSSHKPLNDVDRYDAASRGPWGALGLLARFRFARSPLTLLAALITLVSLAVDPFTQQMLQYKNCLQPGSEIASATVSRSSNYSAAGIHEFAGEDTLDFPMFATLYQGVLNPPINATSSISYNCPSGNCTFGGDPTNLETYRSLGICSSVKDITHLVSGSVSYYNWTLPSGLSTYTPTMFMSAAKWPDKITIDYPLFPFQAIMVRCIPGTVNLTAGACNTEPFAFEATLTPCLHTYTSANISKNVLYEKLIDTVHIPFVESNQSASYYSLIGDYPAFGNVDCTTPSKKPTQNNVLAASKLPNTDFRYRNLATHPKDPDILYYPQACGWEFSWQSWESISAVLGQNFFGYFSDDTDQPLATAMNLSAAYGSPYTVSLGPEWLQKLYANGSVDIDTTTTFMEGLANAMTATIRERGDPSNSEPLRGTNLVNQTCVHVQWAWITLPAVLLVLTLLFFAGMLLQSRMDRRVGDVNRSVWKSSSLPLLWCGLDDDIKRRYGAMDDLRTMKEKGRELDVKLEMESKAVLGGGRLVLR